ncbi:MAG: FHA domain-containing protein [Myxococcales bacterium]|nr:FHA domain-containing protein [Myxococcales bacterium]MCB9627404.1 FHA domain-containing protein [Sandaracinaceae bacterium]
MPVGEFVIGRSAECHLALDDTLVSRRHASLDVRADSVRIRDLGSRNGVSVNGTPISGDHTLTHMDRITIGGQQMTFVEFQPSTGVGRPTTDMLRCPACGHFAEAKTRVCTNCGTAFSMSHATVEIQLDPNATLSTEGRSVSAFALISNLAQKSLQLNKFTDAQQMLRPHMDNLLAKLRQEGSGSHANTDVGTLSTATRFALQLAEGLESQEWLDWVLEAHLAASVLLSSDHIEHMHVLVRKVRYRNVKALRAYMEAMQARAHAFSPAERFRLKRLEGLERVIAA